MWGSPGDPVLRTLELSLLKVRVGPPVGELDIPQAVRCGQNQETQKTKECQNSGVCDSQPVVFPEDTVPHTVSQDVKGRGDHRPSCSRDESGGVSEEGLSDREGGEGMEDRSKT